MKIHSVKIKSQREIRKEEEDELRAGMQREEGRVSTYREKRFYRHKSAFTEFNLFLPRRRPILYDSSCKFPGRKFAFLCLITLIATGMRERKVQLIMHG